LVNTMMVHQHSLAGSSVRGYVKASLFLNCLYPLSTLTNLTPKNCFPKKLTSISKNLELYAAFFLYV